MKVIYLRSGGKLKDHLKPDIDQFTRRVEVDDSLSVRQILRELNIPDGLVAFAFVDGNFKKLDHIPQHEEIVILQPPVSGG